MTTTALQEKLATGGARIGEFGGARTPANFGDPRTEFRALVQGCAIFDLSWRGKLVLTGEDRVRWLNGMVTNNVRDLPLNHGNYSFLLNAQGRIQGDLDIYNRGEYLLATSEFAQLSKMRETFDRYIIMDDVEVTDVSEKLASIGIAGPKSREVLTSAGFDFGTLLPFQVQDLEWRGIGLSIVRASERYESYEFWFNPANAEMLWDAMLASGAIPVGYEALEWLRIVYGRPRYGQDIGERDLPQETAQEHALHYSKGCYIGQEIVERIHSRGNVHRTLVGFEVQGPPPERGTKLQGGGKDVGEITSAATIPFAGGERTLALGYVRREHAAPGIELSAAGTTVRVASLPFTID